MSFARFSTRRGFAFRNIYPTRSILGIVEAVRT
jgi:hypothetical protein